MTTFTQTDYTSLPPGSVHEPLYVIAVISNPMRYKTRYRLFSEFMDRMRKEQGIVIVSVELQNGIREFVTDATFKVRTDTVIWSKENLINYAINRLPRHAKYVAWIDTDVQFNRPDWVQETLHQLQLYPIVQMWSHADDLGPNSETLQQHTSFAYQLVHGKLKLTQKYACKWHPGYAFATRIDFLNNIGCLPDYCVVGSADRMLCLSVIGKLSEHLDKRFSEGYRNKLIDLERRCIKYGNYAMGCVVGTIQHFFHGKKANRKYVERNDIIIKHKYDPNTDLKMNRYGILEIDDDAYLLRDDLYRYFLVRNEDSIDVE